MKRIVSTLFFILIISSITLGQEQSQSLNTDNNFDPVIYNYSPPNIGVETEVTGIRLFIKFYLDDKAYELVEESNQEELTVDVSINITNQSTIAPFTKTLKISRKEPEQMLVYDLGALISDGLSHDINITPNFNNSTNVFTSNHKASIKLNTKLVSNYHTGTELTAGGKEIMELDNVIPPINPGAMSRIIRFSWTADNPYPAFQLQVVKLYNTDPLKKESREITTQVDWSKALTLELFNDGNTTGSKSVAINIIEGTGYYVWRVRPLGNFGKGLTSDPRNLGGWSVHPDNSVLEINQTTSADYLFYFIDPEEDKNWSYTRVFSEDVDKRKGIIQFANGLNFVRQTQTYLQSSKITLVTQAVTDYTGRTSINTMPVPISGEDDLKTYKTDFFRTESNELYTAKDFDTDINFRNPAKNNANNAFSYYSGTDGLVPDAKQYAFSRVIYYNDGTGRVKEQTGVGETHHIGTGAGGKTTRFYYTSPTDAELITLFGIEAPSPESVMKITTVDPNGVAFVQYKGKDGKLLATAIQENATANTVLEELNYPEKYPVTNELGNNTELENKLTLSSRDGFVTSKRFVLTHTVEAFKVKYTPPSAFWTTNFGNCVDGNCTYNLKIEIFDLNAVDNQPVWSEEREVNVDLNEPIEWTFSLADGEYIVVKTLTPSENNIGEISANNMISKVQPVIRLIQHWLKTYVQKEEEDGGWSLNYFYQQVIDIPNSINQSEYVFFKDLVEADEPVINWPPDDNFRNALNIDNIVITEDQNQQPAELIIYTCGEPLVIPLTPELPPYKCVDDEEIQTAINSGVLETFYETHFNLPYDPDNDQGLLNFEDYMIKKLGESGWSESNIYSQLMGKYNKGEFNRMIFHMLTDVYAQANGYGGTSEPDDKLISMREAKIQYTCNELWPKWVNTVRIIEDITENNGIHNVADSFDDEVGNESDLNDHFDDNFKPPFGGGLFKWLFKLVMHAKMRNFSGANKVNVKIKQNLPYMFLEAAGHKFARIVDPFMASGGADPIAALWGITYVVPEEHKPNFKVLPEDQSDYDKYVRGSDVSDDMPFIRCPVFAFKYFYYNSYKRRHIFNPKKYINYEGWEICEREMNYGLIELPNDNDCLMNPSTIKLYADWDFIDREMFYRCIIYRPEMPEPGDEEQASCSDYHIPTMIDNLNEDCREAIDKREIEFYNSLKAELKDHGYILGGCEGDNVITNAFLQEMTRGMVEQLKANTCNLEYNSAQDYCIENFECDPGYIHIDLNPDNNPNKIKSMYYVMYGDIKLNYKLPAENCPETPTHVLHVQNGQVQQSGN